MAWVARGAVGITMCIYLVTGIAGYLAFAQYTQADIISSYECVEGNQLPGDGYSNGHIAVPRALILIVQTGIGAALTLSFPVIAFELRHCLELLAFGEGHVSFGAHAGVVVVMVVACGALGVFVPNLGEVFGFAGATTSNLIVFVMPALFFLNIHWKQQSGGAGLSEKAAPLVTLADGTVLIPGEDDNRLDAAGRGGGGGGGGRSDAGPGEFEAVQHSTPNSAGSSNGNANGMNKAYSGAGMLDEAALLDSNGIGSGLQATTGTINAPGGIDHEMDGGGSPSASSSWGMAAGGPGNTAGRRSDEMAIMKSGAAQAGAVEGSVVSDSDVYIAWVLLVIGLVLIPVCVTVQIVKIVQSKGSGDQCAAT